MSAEARFDFGGFLLMENVPTSPPISVGIDLHEWTIDKNFRGFKMIPPGLHFIHYTHPQAQQRMGFFHFFKPRELILSRWQPDLEELIFITEDQVITRYVENIRDFDRYLGAYPLENEADRQKYKRWQLLSHTISPALIQRIMPTGRVTSMTSSTIEDETGIQVDDALQLLFTPIDLKHSFPKEAMGAERSRWSQDKSWLLRSLICSSQAQSDLVSELQLSFILLLLGHNFEGFEQWKRIVCCFAFSKEAWRRDPDLDLGTTLKGFLLTLTTHLQQVPEDFFRDLISSDNFLRDALKQLYLTLFMNETFIDEQLRAPMKQLFEFAHDKFKWDLAAEVMEEERILDLEKGEDAPVVVHLPTEVGN